MKASTLHPPAARVHSRSSGGMLPVLARWLLGAAFIYLGASKAVEPVEFLKVVRQYNLLKSPLLLNLVSSALPWFEIFCGLLLVAGVAVRGTAALVLAMLALFTGAIIWRALAEAELSGLALCAVRFDCGCGAGEVLACRKFVENGLLMALAAFLSVSNAPRFCWLHSIHKQLSPPRTTP